MYSLVATWYLKPDRQSEGIAALRQMAIDVEKNEPNTWGYLVHSGDDGSAPPCPEGTVVFIEIYKDYQSFLDHVEGPTFTTFTKTYGDLFQPTPGGHSPFFEVTNINRIQGFLRPQAGSA